MIQARYRCECDNCGTFSNIVYCSIEELLCGCKVGGWLYTVVHGADPKTYCAKCKADVLAEAASTDKEPPGAEEER